MDTAALAVVVAVAVIENRHQPSEKETADVELGLFAVAFRLPVVVSKVALIAAVKPPAGRVKRILRPKDFTQTEKV